MLNVEKEQGKHGLNIWKLLEAVQFLKQVTVIHCKGHQKGQTEVINMGNNEAYGVSKRAALEPVTWQLPLIPKRTDLSNYSPVCTNEEIDKAQKRGFSRDLGGHGWLVNGYKQYFLPQTKAY